MAMDIEINQYIDRDMLPDNGCFLEKFPELNNKTKMGTKWYYDELMNNATIVNIAIGCGAGENCKLPSGEDMQMPEHNFGNGEQTLSETERKLVEAQTKHIVNQVAEQVQKMQGNVPGHIAEILERINKIEPPKFDWKGYIRRFAGTAIKTYTKKSRRKYNKRYLQSSGKIL